MKLEDIITLGGTQEDMDLMRDIITDSESETVPIIKEKKAKKEKIDEKVKIIKIVFN